MLTTHQFLMLSEKYQVRFLVNYLSNLDEFLVFIELAKLQKLIIDYDVVKKALDIWTSRLTLEEEIEEEYSAYYFDDEQIKQLEQRKALKEKRLIQIQGIGLRMRLTRSFSDRYEIPSKDVLKYKEGLTITEQKNGNNKKRSEKKKRNRETKRKNSKDERRLSLGCVTLATRASFIALAA
jgi:hypothetical protein